MMITAQTFRITLIGSSVPWLLERSSLLGFQLEKAFRLRVVDTIRIGLCAVVAILVHCSTPCCIMDGIISILHFDELWLKHIPDTPGQVCARALINLQKESPSAVCRAIGLVPCAIGGASLDEWQKSYTGDMPFGVLLLLDRARAYSFVSCLSRMTIDHASLARQGGAYSFVACLSRMTIDHASLARRRGERTQFLLALVV